jgi:hypothetical protein
MQSKVPVSNFNPVRIFSNRYTTKKIHDVEMALQSLIMAYYACILEGRNLDQETNSKSIALLLTVVIMVLNI